MILWQWRSTRSLLLLLVLIVGIHGPTIVVQASDLAAPACFQETGQCLGGRFLDYWQTNGGLAQFGFPLTGEQPELLEDGKIYTVQYFERARFELHQENAAPYGVLLGQFGRRVLSGDYHGDVAGYQRATAPVAPAGQGRFFPETGHTIAPRFQQYWEQHGGLARLEYHSENVGTPYAVLLGQFGRRILADNALLAGPFRALYLTNEAVRLRFGHPINPAAQSPGALQAFEHGWMYYSTRSAPDYVGEPIIYVLCGTPGRGQIPVGHTAAFYRDTWAEGQNPGGGAAPVPGLFLPQRGFGKVWRENPDVQQCLGYATSATETAFPITVQLLPAGCSC